MALIECSEQFIKAKYEMSLIEQTYGKLKELRYLRKPHFQEGGTRTYYIDVKGKKPSEYLNLEFYESDGKIVMGEN